MFKSAFDPGMRMGHFEIIKKLGEGGMAGVYLAKDLTLSRKAALKILDQDRLRTVSATQRDSFQKRFIREAQTAAMIHHQNIAQLFEANLDAEIWYYAMEYVDGSTLRDTVMSGPYLPIDRVIEIFLEILEGLKFSWDKHRIIHRDLNPLNVMLTREGNVKIIDLGLSKPAIYDEFGEDFTKITSTGTSIGTPYYMAPEQATGKKGIDNKVDIFGLAVTIYEVCTKRRAFNGGSPYEIYRAQIAKEYTPIRALRDDVPFELEHLLDQMLEPEYEDRISDYDSIITTIKSMNTIFRFKPLVAPKKD